jgi:hypothetical protein
MGRRASLRVSFAERVPGCFLCKATEYGDDYRLWILHDGRLVEVCGTCLDKYVEED